MGKLFYQVRTKHICRRSSLLVFRFLEAYHENNITFWGLTVQNEPTTGSDANYGWQTMFFNAQTQRDFIRDTLGPTLNRSTLGRSIALMTMDDQRYELPAWPDTVIRESVIIHVYVLVGVCR